MMPLSANLVILQIKRCSRLHYGHTQRLSHNDSLSTELSYAEPCRFLPEAPKPVRGLHDTKKDEPGTALQLGWNLGLRDV